MKKWLITYLFIVCAICLHAGGFVTPASTGYTNNNSCASITSFKTFTFKKASSSLYDPPGKKGVNIFLYQHGIRILNTVSSSYIADMNFYFSTSCHVPGEVKSTREVERVLKDHLLHLFPSHFFW